MFKKVDKNKLRNKRHARIRNKITGTSSCPRLSVYRSLNNIYAQVIDDTKGITLASASTKDTSIAEELKGKNGIAQAELVGKLIAERAKKKKIKSVVYDRGGYLFAGRVQALAESARKNGLEF